MRVLLAGGGSIGHIAPSVAVARELLRLDTEAKVYFVCSQRSDEEEFLRKEKFPFSSIPRPKIDPTFPVRYLQARRAARRIFDAFRPDVVFLKGGSLTIPVALLARKRGIPIVLHESDAVSGRANRFLSRFATVVCTGFPAQEKERRRGGTRTRLAEKCVFTGNPIREDIARGSAEKGLKISNLSGNQPILLVWGGSQGARALNQAVHDHLQELLAFCDIIHLTGQGKDLTKNRAIAGYYERPFAHDDLPHLLAITDLALSRAGAGSIGELAACGIPTILVPLRGVAQDHQVKNADMAVKNGGCIVLDQRDLSQTLVKTVRTLFHDARSRERMVQKIQKLAIPEAGAHIAEIVMEAGSRYSRAHP